jgi:uncharacterized protein (TIGR00251 family)
MSWYRWDGEDLLLSLRVQPRAARDEFCCPFGDAFKIRITAAPVDGQANMHLRRFLAKAFGTSTGKVQLEHGATARSKTFRIRQPSCFPIAVEPRHQEK